MPLVFIKAGEGPIQDAASRMEPRLRAAFLAAVERLRGGVEEDALMKALATGDIDKVLAVLALDKKLVNLLNGEDMPNGTESLKDALLVSAANGGAAAVRALPSKVRLNMSFDLKSLDAQSFLESYAFPLIRQISDNTREGIRGVVLNAFKEGGHPFEQARLIRDMIGLTANQTAAVMNYRSALQGTGASLRSALTRSLRDGRFDPTVARAARNNATLSPKQIDTMTGRYYERFVNYRAKTIARTESLRASNMGQRAAWSKAVKLGLLPKDQEREWEVSGDENTCPECLALDGQRTGLNEEFAPGIMEPPDPHPTCVLGNTLAYSEIVESVSERQFDGIIVVIRTASGKELSCTPNHPILTDRGWCPAGSLDIGNYVVSSVNSPVRVERTNALIRGDMNHQNMPTVIKHIADAFRRSPHVLSRPVPTTSEDFHGDGMRGEVAVIYTDSLLRREHESAFRKFLVDFDLISTLPVLPGLIGQSTKFFGFNTNLCATHRVMCGFSPAFSLTDGGTLHSQEHRLGLVARLYAFLDKSRTYTGARDVEMLSEPKHRPTGSVFLDKVVYRYVHSFSGHVFNLQTASQEYEANGIITHNCRCTTKLVFAK